MAFLDVLGENLTKLGNGVTNKTKEVVETSNLSGQLKTCEDSLKKYYYEIGKAYYDSCKGEATGEFTELFAKVKEANDAIEHISTQLRKIKGTKVCVNCSAEVPSNSVFCSSCGSKVDEVVKREQTGIVCPKCGNTNTEGSAFCFNCGEKLS